VWLALAYTAYTLGVVIFVVGIMISIALHEVGHMLPAKRFGVRVSQFMVGFGKTLWSRQRGETEYGFKAIPLGGYVRMVGMIPPAHEVKEVHGTGWSSRLIADTRDASIEEVHQGEEHRAFYRLAWWKKVIVMSGGPIMNLIIAAVLFTVIFSAIGGPRTVPTVAAVVPCALESIDVDCAAGDPASAAASAGLMEGDVITAIDGATIATWPELSTAMRAANGVPTEVELLRGDQTLTVTVTPTSRDYYTFDAAGDVVYDAAGQPVLAPSGFFGMQPGIDRFRYPIGTGVEVTWEYLGLTFTAVRELPQHVASAFGAIVGWQERDVGGVISIVGAGRIAGQDAAAEGPFIDKFIRALGLLAGVNLALFVFNMIPLLPLDGGHIAGALWQAIKNGWARVKNLPRPAPVDLARMMPYAYGMFAVLVVVGLVLIVADFVAPVNIG